MTRLGRKPFADRALVRDRFVVVKLKEAELSQLRAAAEQASAEDGRKVSVSRYVRELVLGDARRRGLLR
jgi:hypothetical protein